MKNMIFIFILSALFLGNAEIIPERSERASNFCRVGSSCVPISSCPLLQDLMKNECVANNRVSSLGCGYQGSGLVCCPYTSGSANINNDPKYSNGQTCGQSAVLGDGYQGIGSYPFVARVGYKNVQNGVMKYPCTGSIINKRVILTAAHCALAKAQNYKLFSVRLGEYSTNSDLDCGEEFCGLPNQDIQISHVIIHPRYEKQTYKNNIALIILRSAMNFSVTVQPICLPESYSVTSNNGILVGWGKIAGQTANSISQQALRLPIVSLRKCATIYGATIPISEEHLCAGGENGIDACTGFGGAPLLVKHGHTFYQVGILSFGSDQCGARGVPSVYTNIKYFVNWIKENLPVIYNN